MSLLSRFKDAYRTRRAFRWAVEGFLLAALLLAIGAWQTRRHLSDVPVPDFTLPTLEGGTVSSSSLRGQPTMLVLWAPWCGVCKAQSDNVNRVQRWLAGRARVVSMALAYEAKADVEAAAKAEGMEYPVLLGDSALETTFHVDAYPTVYFLDEAGHIKRSASGYTTTLGMLWRLWL
ncbi:MAG: TlpA disulfide reductase family protein [Myxococcota bacterium]